VYIAVLYGFGECVNCLANDYLSLDCCT